ncbi:MAG: hypothetical protein ABFD98_00100 [Syntrophobacteraceae bacterium]|nr:hypothetical protein [Desulfobacteraceae bacterium]
MNTVEKAPGKEPVEEPAKKAAGEGMPPVCIAEATISKDFLKRFEPKRRPRPRRRLPWIAALGAAILLFGASNLEVDGAVYFLNRVPVHRVKITAYTNVPQCTDSTPNETASMLRIKRKHYWKLVALSRDLARGYKFGDRFILRVNGRDYPVEFQDLMAARHRNKIDFLLPSVKRAMKFGVNDGVLIPVGKPEKRQTRNTG